MQVKIVKFCISFLFLFRLLPKDTVELCSTLFCPLFYFNKVDREVDLSKI